VTAIRSMKVHYLESKLNIGRSQPGSYS